MDSVKDVYPIDMEYFRRPDGILYRVMIPEDFDQCRELFCDLWAEENRIYGAVNVTKEELLPYSQILIDRAKAHPWTAAVAIDENKSKQQKKITMILILNIKSRSTQTCELFFRERYGNSKTQKLRLHPN